MSILTTSSQVIRIRGIVQNLKNSGIKVPDELTQEIKLVDELRLEQDTKQAAQLSAMRNLTNASPTDFEAAFSAAKASWEESASAEQFVTQVQAIQYGRVRSALHAASNDLMSQIAGKVNQTVEVYRLNDVRLPESLPTFDVMSASTEDLDAISTYRQAVPQLQLLWGSYKGISNELDQDLSAREFSSALDVAFLVSDVETFHDARALANKFEVLRMGTVSMDKIRQLGIWGLVNLSGHNIEMKSLEEAFYLRGQAQAPMINPTKTPKGKVTILG